MGKDKRSLKIHTRKGAVPKVASLEDAKGIEKQICTNTDITIKPTNAKTDRHCNKQVPDKHMDL